MEIMINDLYFSYKDNEIFNNLNLKFNSNVITGIIGNGKTTLINLITSNLKPNRGSINIDSKGISYVKKTINYNKTAYEILNVNNRSFDINDMIKIIDFDINKLNKKLYLLSESEVNKVLLGSILIQDKEVIIIDSMDSLLDYKTKSLLVKFLRNLKVRYGKTILISSNDVDFIHSVCDEVLLLNDKPIIMDKYKLFTNGNIIKNSKIEIPKLIEISDLIYKKKNIKIGYRDDIKDLIKDIYRYAK